jgi:hypothetical protein
MLIVGYCFGIRSERRLCEEVHLNLAYRWFCRLGLERPVPERSIFSKNRHGRFRDSGTFRWLFDEVLRRCMAAGLVMGEGFAVDASVVAADANGRRSVPGAVGVDWNDEGRRARAVGEYLAARDGSQAPPKYVSLTDPLARWTCASGGPAFFAYSTNYLIDVEHGVIVDVEATPANRSEEVESTKRMIERVEVTFAVKPERLIGDMAYGSAPMLAWLVEDRNIEPHVPVWDKTQRTDGTLSSSDFIWDEAADEYRCPQGQPLRSRWCAFGRPRGRVVTRAGGIIYRSSHHACKDCPLKPRCCPNSSTRKITRSVREEARDVARRINASHEYRRSRRQRKKVEMLFAHLKRILRFDRLRLRGRSGAFDEFTLAATAQNLRRLAKLVGHDRPPDRGLPAPA